MQTRPSIAPSRPISDWSSRSAVRGSPWSAADISEMTTPKRRLSFPGSLTALATPFENDDIAEKAFADLVAWQIEQGSEGLVVGGVTGEAPTLSPREQRRLIEIAVETAPRRVPIVAATGTNCTRETIAFTQAAEAAGVTAALNVTPYYNKPNQEGLYRHFARSPTRSAFLSSSKTTRRGLAWRFARKRWRSWRRRRISLALKT